MTKIGCSESFWTTLVGKDWEKCGMTKNGHSESFWTTLVGKDWKKYRTRKIEYCLYICYKNVKTRVCKKLSLRVLLAIFMFWCPGCLGVLAAICVSWGKYLPKKADPVKILFSLIYCITEFKKYSSKVH